jgi:hypothetical protein
MLRSPTVLDNTDTNVRTREMRTATLWLRKKALKDCNVIV